MSRIVLITGGCRSGKSALAQGMAEALPGRRAFVATSPILDEEMRRRIDRHRLAREGKGWDTIEETVDLAGAIRAGASYSVMLVDCLTLWVNNLIYEADRLGQSLTEEDVATACRRVIDSCEQGPECVVFVTNEVGWGIVPENALARRFRDLAGRCNQTMASRADEVILVVAGLPLTLKGPLHGTFPG